MRPRQTSALCCWFHGDAMRFLITYLRFHSAKLTIAVLVVLILCAVALALLLRPDIARTTTLLGDVHAVPADAREARAAQDGLAAPAVRPVRSELAMDANEREQAAAALEPDSALQQPVLARLNCARALASLPALVLNPTLSEDAAAFGRALAARPDRPLGELGADRYALVAVVPLSADALASVVPTTAQADEAPMAHVLSDTAPVSSCHLGDVDVAQLGLSPEAATVGIAVFADAHPGDGWDTTTAVILAR